MRGFAADDAVAYRWTATQGIQSVIWAALFFAHKRGVVAALPKTLVWIVVKPRGFRAGFVFEVRT
eukprot:1216722-Amphidinium_carterae.1